MSKILVTGATGFVGKHLVSALIALGHEVRCAVSQNIDWLDTEQVLVNKLECNPDWSQALCGVEVVIHLAARVHIMKEKSDSVLDDYYKINSLATKNLAEEAVKHQVKRFIFLSSIKVNGEWTLSDRPFTEECIPATEDPYGKSKLYAEQYLQEISQTSEMQIVIIRPPLIYGPGVKANFYKMMHLVKKRIPLPFAKVSNKRNMVYIDNLISALCVVISHPKAANQTYLVADDEVLSLSQLLRMIGKEMDIQVKLIPVPVPLMNVVFNFLRLSNLGIRLFGSLEVSNHKIKSQLKWHPPVTAAKGLKETVKWFQN